MNKLSDEDIVRIQRLGTKVNRTLNLGMDPEDAAQEAVTKALEALESFNGDSSVYTFCTRAVINHFINLRKKIMRQIVCVDYELTELEEALEQEIEGPQRIIEELELFEKLHQSIATLDEELKYIVFQRVNNETHFAEIARELKQPVNNVKVKLHRAIKRFKKDLGVK